MISNAVFASETNSETGAVFDASHTYRYSLWRRWDAGSSGVAFIMLNPSTADVERNDPTIRRCIGLAQAWSYGWLEVVNLFAYRATQPTQLRQVLDPIGAENDRYLLAAVERADRILLAWGNWGSLHGRDRAVLKLLNQYPVHCLGVNRSGQPRHPLYIRRDVQMTRFAGLL